MAERISIFIENKGLDAMIKAMAEVGKVSFITTGRLEAVLAKAFGQSQERVHVISGRLKASGHTQSDFKGNAWTGEIIYGGEGSQAEYAIFEYAREGERNIAPFTPHKHWMDFTDIEPEFEKAIDSHFSPLKGG